MPPPSRRAAAVLLKFKLNPPARLTASALALGCWQKAEAEAEDAEAEGDVPEGQRSVGAAGYGLLLIVADSERPDPILRGVVRSHAVRFDTVHTGPGSTDSTQRQRQKQTR
jgi:hypothetical protein